MNRTPAPVARLARPVAILAVAVPALALSACYATYRAPLAKVFKHEEEVRFPDAALLAVEVHLRHGHVLVQHGEQLAGDFKLEVRAEDEAEARARASSVRLEPVTREGVCELRVNHATGAPLDAVDIRYRLHVPPHIKLRLFTRSGQVAVRGFRGEIEVQTDSGSIQARPGGGACKLVTASGPIRLAGAYRRAQVKTDTGDIEVTLTPVGAEVELEARSRTGPVLIDKAESCRMWLEYDTGNGDLDTDFPVVWRTANDLTPDRLRRFVGSVGDEAMPQLVKARVHCEKSELEVRRLPDSVAIPNYGTR